MARQAIPPDVLSLADYQRCATNILPEPVLAYIEGGSGQEQSLAHNTGAYSRWSIYNRLLVDCAGGTTRLELPGASLAHPVLLAPVAHQGLIHPHAELACARGAGACDALMVVSTLASRRLEDVAAVATGPLWFQLYFQPLRDATLNLLRRAENAGYAAIVVTLDAPVQTLSRAAQRAGFGFPAGQSGANLSAGPPPPVTLDERDSVVFQGMMSEAPGWDDLVWLLSRARIPLLIKGVSHPDDAARLRDLGAAGLVVSNHGGRTLDGAPAPLDTLPAIREHVGESFPLLVDGGIRSGQDVFKALALGANAILIGRPQLHALAVAGALGVAHMIKLLRDELEITMALAGCPNLASITPDCLRPQAWQTPW